MILFPAVLASTLIQSAMAQLPTLDEPPWLGYFAAHENLRFRFGITSLGQMILTPVGSKGPVSEEVAIKIDPTILETEPGGKVTAKRLIPESLETADSATAEFEKTVFRGKVTGEKSFEVTVELSRGFILIGGRILDPGQNRNPLQFTISADIPNLYRNSEPKDEGDGDGDDTRDAERELKRKEKEFMKKLRADRISLKWTDGKQLRHDLTETVDVKSKEVNGPGIAELELETGSFAGRKVQFTASPHSVMTLSDAELSPLYKGFKVVWTADPAKDPDGKARLAIGVR